MGSNMLCRSCLVQSFQSPVLSSRNGFASARLGSQLLQSAQLRDFLYTEKRGGRKEWKRSYASKPSASISTARPSRPSVRQSRLENTKTQEHGTSLPHYDLSTTRPAPLHLPASPQKDSQGNIGLQTNFTYFYHLGKGYVTFYKNGFKNIWANYKIYKNLNTKILSLPPADIGALLIGQTQNHPNLSRQDFQLYTRTRHDIRKLIPMGLILAVCGEFSPLVVLAVGNVVTPYTCRIPKQVRKQLTKFLSRIETESLDLNLNANASPEDKSKSIAYITGSDPFGICHHRIPLLSPLLWSSLVSRRINHHLDTLYCDALLIRREGGASSLNRDELLRFCIEAGAIDVMQLILDNETPDPSPVLGSRISEKELDRIREGVDGFIERVYKQFGSREARFIEPWPPRLRGKSE